MKNKIIIFVISFVLLAIALGIVWIKFIKNEERVEDLSQNESSATIQEDIHTNDIKLSDVELICEATSTDKLIRYNGVLYGASYAIFDIATIPSTVGVVDSLIDSSLLPIKDFQTNSEDLLGAQISNPVNGHMWVITENDIAHYNAISVDYKDKEVIVKDGKIYNEILIDDFFNDKTFRKESKLTINNEHDKYVIEYILGENDKAYNEAKENSDGENFSYAQTRN